MRATRLGIHADDNPEKPGDLGHLESISYERFLIGRKTSAPKLRRAEERFIPQSTRAVSFRRCWATMRSKCRFRYREEPESDKRNEPEHTPPGADHGAGAPVRERGGEVGRWRAGATRP